MAIRYTHTNIVSKDWKQLARFYTEVFDCSPVPPQRNLSGKWLDEGTGVTNASLQGIHLRLPGFGDKGPTLEIYQYEDIEGNYPPKANRKGFGHLAFHVDNVEQIMEKVVSYAGECLGKVSKKEVPGVGLLTFVYVTDPEGNILELQNWS
ncbi:MAG: glyoxalase [Desulfotalea sp.]|nr:MAG: glyoxalase [Desulfotalea sp.]